MPLVRIARLSLPSTVMTAGCFSIVPTQRIAACGWLMIGVPIDGPEHARVGDRERAALHVVGAQLLGARPLAQVVDGAGHAQQRELVGVLDDRHDESPVERDRDPQVDVAPEHGALAAHGGVDAGVLPEPVGHRLRDEGQVGQVHAPVGVLLLLPRAELGDARVVDLEDRVDVRRDPAGHHHVLGRELPDARPGLDPVAGPGLDGRRVARRRGGARGPARRGGRGRGRRARAPPRPRAPGRSRDSSGCRSW